ncbi:MAG: murein biosynthesis integral membrane protein MurJ [Candidatus Komeilibacteria bacterium]
MSNLFYRLNHSIGGGALVIAFFTLISKLLGLLRDRLLAGQFGAGADLDVYFAAFRLPDFIFNILILGALSVAFIPVFQRVYHQSATAGYRLANSVFNVLLLAIGLLTIIGLITAGPLVRILVPGFTAPQILSTVHLTRIMLISILFFTASNVMSGMLNAWKRFVTFSISSVLYNLGIIIGVVFFLPRWGLVGLAWGVVLGSALHFGIQCTEALIYGWRWQPIIAVTAELRRLFQLMIPRAIGSTATQINIVAITMIASWLPIGALSIFNLANNLQSFPAGLFGISLAVASFPHITRHAQEKDYESFSRVFSLQFRRILYVIIPISILLIIERAHVVRVILGSGSFDWNDTIMTANVLGIFAVSIFAQGLIPLVSFGFYAHEDTKSPVIISLITTLINIILAFVLTRSLGVIGLTAAFSLATILNLLLLVGVFKAKIGHLNEKELLNAALRIALASVIAGAVAYISLRLFLHLIDQRTFWGILLQGLLSGLSGLAVYIAISVIFVFPEIEVLRAYVTRYLRKTRLIKE